jgi:hypothetical protein
MCLYSALTRSDQHFAQTLDSQGASMISGPNGNRNLRWAMT